MFKNGLKILIILSIISTGAPSAFGAGTAQPSAPGERIDADCLKILVTELRSQNKSPDEIQRLLKITSEQFNEATNK